MNICEDLTLAFCIDADELIEEVSDCTWADIFETHGQAMSVDDTAAALLNHRIFKRSMSRYVCEDVSATKLTHADVSAIAVELLNSEAFQDTVRLILRAEIEAEVRTALKSILGGLLGS